MALGLLARAKHDVAVETVAIGITSGSAAITSAGLFTADHEGRLLTVSGSGIPSDTWIDTVVDASNATLSVNATATGARTATLDGYVHVFPNQQTLDPAAGKLDEDHLVLPPFTTGTTGVVKLVLTVFSKGYPASSADSYLEMALVDAADDVLLPSTPGGVGRRVLLSNSIGHPPKLECELALLPNTLYAEAFFAVGAGNQVPGGGAGTGWMIVIGGTHGQATMEVWDLDDGTGPRLVVATPLALALGLPPATYTLGVTDRTASPLALTLGLPSAVANPGTVNVAPAPLALTLAFPAATLQAEGDQTATPLALTLAFPAAATVSDSTVTATALAFVVAFPAATVVAGIATLTGGPLAFVVAFPAPRVVVPRRATIRVVERRTTLRIRPIT